MNRTFKGIVAAAVVLGTAAPMAFAATSSWTSKVAGQLPIVVNGSVLSNPYELTAKDSGNTTAYFPVYYFNQALAKIGYTATWDGVTHTWAITAPGVDATKVAAAIPGGMGTGNTTITVNGTAVKMINTGAAKDPAGGGMTTYFPAYYINEIGTALGASFKFSGQTGLSITGGVNQGAVKLSAITVSGATVGTGTAQSPAINSKAAALSLSTTLTDSNGNPIANTNLSLSITGTASSAVPSVEQGTTYATVSGSGTSASPWTATVTTDSTGTATFNVNGVGAYTVAVDAPYAVSGTTVSQTAYVGFSNTTAVISPTGNPFEPNISTTANMATGVVPVTVTLPPNSDGTAQSGVLVTFAHAPKVGGANDSSFFSNAQGSSLGVTSYSAYTDANGQATVYINDYAADDLNVTASYGTPTKSATTEIAWQNPAAPTTSLSKIGAYAFKDSSPSTSDSNVVSGTSGDAYFEPMSSNGALTASDLDGTTYTLSATNGAYVTAINGVSIPTALGHPSTATVKVSYDSTKGYSYTVDGLQLMSGGSTYYNTTGSPLVTGHPEEFSVSLAEGSKNTSVLTVSSGTVTATANYNFSNAAVSATSFTPAGSTLQTGQSENVTYTVVDANGNPVANQSTEVDLDYNNNPYGLWISAVNGTALSGPFGTSAATIATPIPTSSHDDGVAATNSSKPLADLYVSLAGVANWSGSNPGVVNVWTNANGQVTLTLVAGNTVAWGAYAAGNTNPVSTSVFTYNYNNGTPTNPTGQVYLGQSSPWTAANSQQIGGISW